MGKKRKRVTCTKISPEMVNHRHITGKTEDKDLLEIKLLPKQGRFISDFSFAGIAISNGSLVFSIHPCLSALQNIDS